MSSNPSLRDQYIPPSSAWAFGPPQHNVTAPSTSTAPSNGYQWSTRPAPNSIFDLSPSLDLNEPSSINVSLLLRSLIASGLFQYASTAIAMPLEVGKLLLQIQWVPKQAPTTEVELVEEVEEEEVLSDTTNEDESYFADPNVILPTKYPAPQLVDEKGYIIRMSVMEDGTRPEYVIPVGSMDGTWAMIKRLASFRGEGWLSLWKGLLTLCIHDVIFSNVQPIVDNILHSLFFSSPSGMYRPPLLLPIASHVITGFLVSPLDLIRTRLIAQSSMQRYKTYNGSLDAFSQILANEGGLKGIYLHPHILIPTLLDNTLRPLMHLLMPSLIAPWLGFGPHVAPDTYPIAWGIAEFVGGCVGLLITLPIETVRRRLQVQTRGKANPLRTCVETRPVPYNGVVDALWHIVTEERSDIPIKKRRSRSKKNAQNEDQPEDEKDEQDGEDGESWLKNTGIGQLYRGLGMRIGASAVVLLLTALGGYDDTDAGWAEL
ncbi:mitochondrial carrier domain-containing protein [Hygrophoropsis aurantiaca]|uniref:Mitochondrial carrier domain-containing protein n=1 Tax=Hygrophoropsis aurantiaca TaxID=72124 RepID=A0ACB8AQ96_9AGAM|nr:mitochondrial carrier domain-containing protein [Hygrophoropsis aurantiaca]